MDDKLFNVVVRINENNDIKICQGTTTKDSATIIVGDNEYEKFGEECKILRYGELDAKKDYTKVHPCSVTRIYCVKDEKGKDIKTFGTTDKYSSLIRVDENMFLKKDKRLDVAKIFQPYGNPTNLEA